MTAQTATPQIITFYSYKGGTGRTMALANVAWILAANGQRVLAVDWDLESPGLHRYFHPFLRDKQLRRPRGVIDMVRDYAAAAMAPASDRDRLDWIAEHADVLHARGVAGLAVPRRAAAVDFSPPAGRTRRTRRRSAPSTGATSTTGSAAAPSCARCATACASTTTTC